MSFSINLDSLTFINELERRGLLALSQPVDELDPYILPDTKIYRFTTVDGNNLYAMRSDEPLSFQRDLPNGLMVEKVYSDSIFWNDSPRMLDYLNSRPEDELAVLADRMGMRYKHFTQNFTSLTGKISSIVWQMGSSFEDLTALAMMTVQGLFPLSPFHAGPLYPDCAIINFAELNRLGIITVDSQPSSDDQVPYLTFFCKRDISHALIHELIIRVPTVAAKIVDPQTGVNYIFNYPTDPKYYPKFGDKISYHIPLHYDDTDFRTFGNNFVDLIMKELVTVEISDIQKTNIMFEELINIQRMLS